MSKALDATCVNNKVTIEGQEIDGAVILSQGKAQSSGVAIVDKEKVTYVTSNASDIQTAITKLNLVIDDLVSALTKVTTSLTAITGNMTGPTTSPPPTVATDVADITVKIGTLNSTKAELETLKDNLK